ncbi:toxin [Photobacterium phosphoreum]|uniref:Toxin n=1 Tax=Photobacterium phosphoreum TaxID=659 RepID=A0A2T3JU38_PHOPO|nr:zonular occludens toxin domain-containing protein [Photobacterium phosphoreum]PSU20272.1 toxin [Photobacterium phosphoreum]PSU38982.1 toxin [Photobacterium phosphoreum]PSU52694.1 toxin [Photobacterium phosphoreum]
MATSFRYGANGSYKSACAVWFDLLPALREGRICVTNVEGMQPLDIIQKRLGEKFPDSTKLIRINSRNKDGIALWQSWFCWMPIGAFVLIDECQDLFGKHVGFKMQNQAYKPFEDFESLLPDGFKKLFYDAWKPVDISTLDAGELDDTGRTQFDEKGRLLYPFEFNGAFMRHRKYNWDIVLLTPDWKQIPSEIKGCAEVAKGHVNKDMMFNKRKPRIFEHHPTASSSKPSANDLVYRQKVPVEVHLLYSSTGTGKITKSGAASALFKQPKLYVVFLIFVLCIVGLIYVVSSRLSNVEDSSTQVLEQNKVTEVQSSGDHQKDIDQSRSVSRGVVVPDGSGVVNKNDAGFMGSLVEIFPFIQNVKQAYITAFNVNKSDGKVTFDLVFKVEAQSGDYYVPNSTLKSLDVDLEIIDECLVRLKQNGRFVYVTCPPAFNGIDKDDKSELTNDLESKPTVNLF